MILRDRRFERKKRKLLTPAKSEPTAHGDDPWARTFAQKVIDAQTQEIKDMKASLVNQTK